MFALSTQHLVRKEYPQARAGFAKVISMDPGMCDAWLGRLAAGENALEVYAGAYEARRTVGHGAKAARTALDKMAPKTTFDLGAMELTLPIRTEVHVTVAYAAALASQERPDLAGAAAVVEKLRTRQGLSAFDVDLLDYVNMCLMGLALRWPDILTFIQSHRWALLTPATDPEGQTARTSFLGLLKLGQLVWHVRAMAGTGNPEEAQRWVEDRLTNADEPIALDVQVRLRMARVYALRMQGKDDEALQALKEVQALSNSGEVAEAAADPAKVIEKVTAESLATRTDIWDPTTGTSAQQIEDQKLELEREVAREESLRDLDEQVGQQALKRQIERLGASVTMAQRRASKGMEDKDIALAFSFVGPPGTGKTTMARALAKMLFGMGIIARPDVKEVRGKDLVGQHLGTTPKITNDIINASLGGVLFIDEAYALATKGFSGGDAYGKEAIDTLLARMENERRTDDPKKKLVVVIAGYEDEIRDLMDVNIGLPSRFTRKVIFPTYTPVELVDIAAAMGAKDNAVFGAGCQDALLKGVTALAGEIVKRTDELGNQLIRPAIDFAGNARFMRNIVEIAKENRDLRLVSDPDAEDDAMRTLDVADLVAAFEESCINQDVPVPA